MRGKVPDDIYVVLKQAEVHSCGVVVVEFAKFAGIDELLDLPHRSGEQEGMVHHDLEMLALGQVR